MRRVTNGQYLCIHACLHVHEAYDGSRLWNFQMYVRVKRQHGRASHTLCLLVVLTACALELSLNVY